MAQSLKQKIHKLSDQFNITAIISTAKDVQAELADIAAWNSMTVEGKTQWFIDQCAKYNLTVTDLSICNVEHNYLNRIIVNEFEHEYSSQHPYFTVFLPHHKVWRGVGDDAWQLEIGSAYASHKHGEIWTTARGLKGKEKQISEVMRLRKLLEL